MKHEAFCAGWHTADMTCQDATDQRAKRRDDPFRCAYGRYHGFSDEDPDSTCEHEGCGTTLGTLLAVAPRTWRDLAAPRRPEEHP